MAFWHDKREQDGGERGDYLGGGGDDAFVGLPYTSTLQPMPLEFQLQDGTAQGRKFNSQRAQLLLYKSLGGTIRHATGGTAYAIEYPVGTTTAFPGAKTSTSKQTGPTP